MKIPWALAKTQADKLVAELRPYMRKIEIAGSVRRKAPAVHDIEIVAIRHPGRLFDLAALFDRPGWRITKGSAGGKYIQFARTPHSDQLDLFFATEDNWGYIYTIRTGSADFSKKLAARWVELGYEGRDGMLTLQGDPVRIPDEFYLFNLLQLRYVPPEMRS